MPSRFPATLAAAAALLCATLPAASPVLAKEAGDWIFRAGATHIAPKSDNGSLDADSDVGVDVSSATTFDVSRMLTDSFAIELLAALPFKHDVSLQGLGEVASVKHLPPTLSAQYHFNPTGKVSPYIGAGLNWTIVFDEKSKGALDGVDIKAGNSVGPALQAGLDWEVSDKVLLNLGIRWMDIDTKVKTDGVRAAKVKIDPLIYAVNLGYRF